MSSSDHFSNNNNNNNTQQEQEEESLNYGPSMGPSSYYKNFEESDPAAPPQKIPFTELKTQEQYAFVKGQLSYFDILYMPYTPCGPIFDRLKPSIESKTKQKRRQEEYYQTQWDKQLELKAKEEQKQLESKSRQQASSSMSTMSQAQQIQHQQQLKLEQKRKQQQQKKPELDPVLVQQFKDCLALNRKFYEKRAENLNNFKKSVTSIY